MKDSFSKAFFFAGLFVVISMHTIAQPKLYPIRLHQSVPHTTPNARTQGGGDDPVFVTLPFFDDFSGQVGAPDTNKWQSGEGVFVNNTFGIDVHTAGVATFDGLKENGEPYSLDVLGLTGEADKLTSHCFDFSGYTQANALLLSFYWQAQGLGELPNPEDYLRLEFLNNQGDWIEQWRVNGDTLTDFEYEEFTITDPSYLHAQFQFRFVVFGRLSGGYDTWNLDYVYLNTTANRNVDVPIDFGMTNVSREALHTYTALPKSHFLNHMDSVWNDTVQVGVRSAFAQARNIRRVSLITEVYDSATRVDSTFSAPFGNIQAALDPLASTTLAFENDPTLFTGLTTDSITLKQTFVVDLLTQASDQALTSANDTLISTTIFSDYYAYDDGSAELGYGVNEKFGKIAYQFENYQEDTLRYIDIFLAQLGGRASGSFKIKVWESLDTLTGEDVEIFTSTSLPILYQEGLNTFQRLELEDYIPLPTGTFFIGIEQLSDQNIMIGFDKNQDSGDKIFYNLGTKWFQNKQFQGSLMIRPVFEFPSTVTGLDEDLAMLKQVKVYPNPTQQQVWLSGEVDQAVLYTISGKVILQKEFSNSSSEAKQMNLPQLAEGIYILKVQKGNAVIAQKLMIQNP
ncbi:MAG: T9SS type A sorting domain-containing protein [Flammeovirgaceae bacterium]